MKRTFEQKREQVLKRLKVSPEKPKGTQLALSPKEETPKPSFTVGNEYDKVNLDVSIYQKRGGSRERIPKVHKKDDNKQYNVTVTLHPIREHWS